MRLVSLISNINYIGGIDINYFKLSILIGLLIICFVGTLFGCMHSNIEDTIFLTEEERAWLDAHKGLIRIGYTIDYPPVEYLINGEYVGVSADYFRLLQEKLGINIEMVQFDQWTDLLESAMNREITGITAATKTPARSEYFDFTLPYIFNPNVIITRVNFSEKLSFEKLSNSTLKVLVEEGYAIVEYLEQNYPMIDFETVSSGREGLRKVSFGEADAIIMEIMSASASIEHDKITNLIVNTETPYESHLSIATRNDWPILSDILNKGLAQITTAERAYIRSKWVALEKKSILDNPYFWVGIGLAILIISIVMVLIIAWNRTLTKAVQDKTKELESSKENLLVQNKQLESTERKLLEEISIRKRSEEEIKYRSFHDELTGLYNRAFYNDQLANYSRLEVVPISIILADLNGLKITNDTLGHDEGDRLLVNVASILKANTRAQDTVARIGGDEFVIIMPFADEKSVSAVADRIKKACSSSANVPIKPSLAIGHATKNDSLITLQTVFKQAEDNMYQNKMFESESTNVNILSSLKALLRETTLETAEHSRRLEKMAFPIGQELSLSEKDLNALITLADLHDLGKVAIPESILNKSGPLAQEEWEKIKRHPEIGYRIVNTSPKLAQIAQGILSHHERWDGTGYPLGLKGDKIPILARIISVVDAYDVMTNFRPYRDPISSEEAVDEIVRCRGTQFDPLIVDIFVRLISNKNF